jgi:GTPase SAR1 family protein
VTLLGEVDGLLSHAATAAEGTPVAPEIAELQRRLHEPLRLAIAGRVKAGKSTLVNALIGEELAPTDAGECTRIVTWYVDGPTYRVTLQPRTGAARPVPFRRNGGALDVDIGATATDDVERLVVEWPSASLRTTTLIDTPGIASLSEDVSARTVEFLTPGEDQVTAADAVVYLLRHLHTTDLRFLEAFHDDEVAQATPVNTIAVLSRADEVAAGRLDAMTSAARIAERWRQDPKLRRLCQTVVPVAGLIAETGRTLREAEFEALRTLAGEDRAGTDELLRSVDAFLADAPRCRVTSPEREVLLDRLGLFGVRLSLGLIRLGGITTAAALAEELLERSGLHELRQTLASQFSARRDVLKCRSVLLALEAIVERAGPGPAWSGVAGDLERIMAGAHEFAELRLLHALRVGAVAVKDDERDAMERLLGVAGTSPAARLGLAVDAGADDVRQALGDALGRWRRRAESPISSRAVADAARVLVRTCEGLLMAAQPTG